MPSKTVNLSGSLFLAELDDKKQKKSGFFQVGEVYPFTFTMNTKTVKLLSGLKGQRGQTAASKVKIESIEGSATFKTIVAKTIAMMLFGKAVKNTATAGSATLTDFTIPVDGTWGKLPHDKVNTVKVDAVVLGEDYEVNEAVGLIRVAPGKDGSILGGEKPVTYDYAAGAGYDITVGNSSTTRFAVLIDGRDESDESNVKIEFDSAVFAPSGGFPLIEDPETDFTDWQCSIDFETLPGKDSPGTINGMMLSEFADT